MPNNAVMRAEAVKCNFSIREIASYCSLHPFLRETARENGLTSGAIPLKVPLSYRNRIVMHCNRR